MKTVLRDAVVVAFVSFGFALAANSLRSSGAIALVAQQQYEILVPCPEFKGTPAKPLEASGALDHETGVAWVDAREQRAYVEWHLPGAISIPFDYLEPQPEERKVLRTRALRVIVYGDGDQPDSGKQLANTLSGVGVKNVFYVKGGVVALRKTMATMEAGR